MCLNKNTFFRKTEQFECDSYCKSAFTMQNKCAGLFKPWWV